MCNSSRPDGVGKWSQKFFILNYCAAEIHSGEIKFRAFCCLSVGGIIFYCIIPHVCFCCAAGGGPRNWARVPPLELHARNNLGSAPRSVRAGRSAGNARAWECEWNVSLGGGAVAKAFHHPQLWLAKSLNAAWLCFLLLKMQIPRRSE